MEVMIQKLIDEPYWDQLESRVNEYFDGRPTVKFLYVKGEIHVEEFVLQLVHNDYRKGSFEKLEERNSAEVLKDIQGNLEKIKEILIFKLRRYLEISYIYNYEEEVVRLVSDFYQTAGQTQNVEPLFILVKDMQKDPTNMYVESVMREEIIKKTKILTKNQ